MVRFACKQRFLVVLTLALCILLAGLLPPPQPALAAPTVSLLDPSGPAGTIKVKAAGGGWPTGHYLEIRWPDGRLIGETISPVDAAGNFTTVFSIPEDATPGSYSVVFRDTTNTNISAAATFTVTIPTMSLQPNSGPVSTTITATGSGWPGQKDIEVNWDGTNFLTSAYADTTQQL